MAQCRGPSAKGVQIAAKRSPALAHSAPSDVQGSKRTQWGAQAGRNPCFEADSPVLSPSQVTTPLTPPPRSLRSCRRRTSVHLSSQAASHLQNWTPPWSLACLQTPTPRLCRQLRYQVHALGQGLSGSVGKGAVEQTQRLGQKGPFFNTIVPCVCILASNMDACSPCFPWDSQKYQQKSWQTLSTGAGQSYSMSPAWLRTPEWPC